MKDLAVAYLLTRLIKEFNLEESDVFEIMEECARDWHDAKLRQEVMELVEQFKEQTSHQKTV